MFELVKRTSAISKKKWENCSSKICRFWPACDNPSFFQHLLFVCKFSTLRFIGLREDPRKSTWNFVNASEGRGNTAFSYKLDWKILTFVIICRNFYFLLVTAKASLRTTFVFVNTTKGRPKKRCFLRMYSKKSLFLRRFGNLKANFNKPSLRSFDFQKENMQ